MRRECFSLRIALNVINSKAEKRDCPESMLFGQNCIDVETILRLRCECSRTNTFLLELYQKALILNSYAHDHNLCGCPESMPF